MSDLFYCVQFHVSGGLNYDEDFITSDYEVIKKYIQDTAAAHHGGYVGEIKIYKFQNDVITEIEILGLDASFDPISKELKLGENATNEQGIILNSDEFIGYILISDYLWSSYYLSSDVNIWITKYQQLLQIDRICNGLFSILSSKEKPEASYFDKRYYTTHVYPAAINLVQLLSKNILKINSMSSDNYIIQLANIGLKSIIKDEYNKKYEDKVLLINSLRVPKGLLALDEAYKRYL